MPVSVLLSQDFGTSFFEKSGIPCEFGMAQNTTIPMSLSCCCFGEEASQKHLSEFKQIENANLSKIDPEFKVNCWM